MKNLLTTLAANGTNAIDKPTTIGDNQDTLKDDVTTIINVIVGLVATIAVIVIIIGGISYMTSNGDAGKVKKARDTILYACIGLVICGLAATIVNFVVANM